MKKLHIFVLLLIAVALVATIGILWLTKSSEKPTVSQSSITTSTERQRTNITYIAKADETSLEQLKHEASGVITKQSDYGEYVDTIEGHQGGVDGKYWSFYIDGVMSVVGANNYIQKGGETIQWKFQKL